VNTEVDPSVTILLEGENPLLNSDNSQMAEGLEAFLVYWHSSRLPSSLGSWAVFSMSQLLCMWGTETGSPEHLS
jgi:hypothetical protein